MSQVVFRFEKIKTGAGFVARIGHNERTYPPANADNARKVEVLISAGSDPAETLSKKLSGIKRKKDSVLAVEAILSASPEFFALDKNKIEYGKWNYVNVEAFKQAGIEFFKREFGKNLVSLSFHVDEATPHFQAVFLPIIEGKLNAKSLLGNRKKMIEWQDKAHEAVAHLGIERGLRGSKSRHERVRSYYNDVNSMLPEIPLAPNIVRTEVLAQNAIKIHDKAVDHDRVMRRNKELTRLLVKQEKEIAMLKEEVNRLRALPLHEVLTRIYGAELTDGSKEHHASRKYKVGDSKVGVSQGKRHEVWIDNAGKNGSGTGTIDLVKYLSDTDYNGAIKILSEAFKENEVVAEIINDALPKAIDKARQKVQEAVESPLPVVKPDESQWGVAKQYLSLIRVIPEKIIDSLHSAGKLFADSFGNVVFPRANGGFFKRGRGNFKQTLGKKDCGPYIVEGSGDETVLVEGPVDALSYKALFPEAGPILAIGGNLMEPADVKPYIKTSRLVLAFDNDEKGEKLTVLASDQLKGFEMSRKVPKDKDWNRDLWEKIENRLPIGDEKTVPLDKLFTTPQVSNDGSFPEAAKSPAGNEELNHDETGFKGPGG